MDDKFCALIVGTFLAETAKNLAKGSANWLGSNGKFLFYEEITALGLNEFADAAEITEKLEKNPETLSSILKTIESGPVFVKELFLIIREQIELGRGTVNNINAKNIENVFNQPTGTFNFDKKM